MSTDEFDNAASGEIFGTRPMIENALSASNDCAKIPEPRAAFELEVFACREINYKILHPSAPAFDENEPALANAVGERPILMVVDRAVHRLYGKQIRAYSDRHLNIAALVLIDGHETQKTWRQVEAICETAVTCQLERQAVMVSVGGGVTLDITGFAASIYRRGISYLRIPTTLIGLVDVSIGVKQGINFGGRKNILGSFYPPMLSINDVSFLTTLPATHIAAGIAEMLKMAILRDERLFAILETQGPLLAASRFQYPTSLSVEALKRSEIAMVRELENNLFEADLQRLVDFGHTFSPALEAGSGYQLLHGHAVGLDMLISTHIGVSRALCPESLLRRLLRMYDAFGLPTRQDFCTAKQLHASLHSIRAHRGGNLNLVIPTQIGAPTFVEQVSEAELQEAIRFFAYEGCSYASAGI